MNEDPNPIFNPDELADFGDRLSGVLSDAPRADDPTGAAPPAADLPSALTLEVPPAPLADAPRAPAPDAAPEFAPDTAPDARAKETTARAAALRAAGYLVLSELVLELSLEARRSFVVALRIGARAGKVKGAIYEREPFEVPTRRLNGKSGVMRHPEIVLRDDAETRRALAALRQTHEALARRRGAKQGASSADLLSGAVTFEELAQSTRRASRKPKKPGKP